MEYATDTKKLRKAMVDAGIFTISELSEKSGVCRSTLSDVLDGTIQPSMNTACRIGSALNLLSKAAGEIFFAIKLTQ